MAKLSAHGREVGRFFDPRRCRLTAVMADGSILGRLRERLPAWALTVKRLPSEATLREAVFDGVCESVTGDTVEPDGYGPDGAPSWLRALGMI